MSERLGDVGPDLVLLMGPPGSGKSTLGHALNRRGLARYTELEPVLIERYGRGEEFAQHRPVAHQWIWDFYRCELATAAIPVVMETTGVSGRTFIDEMSRDYRVLFVKLDTPRCQCVQRVVSRPKGAHVNDLDEAAVGEFFDHWHRDTEPNYRFGLMVTGTDLSGDMLLVQKALGQ